MIMSYKKGPRTDVGVEAIGGLNEDRVKFVFAHAPKLSTSNCNGLFFLSILIWLFLVKSRSVALCATLINISVTFSILAAFAYLLAIALDTTKCRPASVGRSRRRQRTCLRKAYGRFWVFARLWVRCEGELWS